MSRKSELAGTLRQRRREATWDLASALYQSKDPATVASLLRACVTSTSLQDDLTPTLRFLADLIDGMTPEEAAAFMYRHTPPPSALEVFSLREEGLSFVEIGQRLGIRPSTARGRVRWQHAAYRKLKAYEDALSAARQRKSGKA